MADMEMNVPDGWTEKALGEILNYEQPYRYSVNSTDYDDKSGTPVLTAGKSFILGYTTETEGIYDNLPVIIFDDFTTDSKYVDFPFKVKSSAMKFLMPKDAETTDLKLVFAHIQRLKIRDLGGDHKRRWISDFSKLKIQLPPPTEQREIARILSKVDEVISQTEQLIAKYRRLKTGLMQDLLTKGIDAHGNIRSEETHAFKDSPLGRIPAEWEVVETGELFEMTLGKMLNREAKHGKDSFPYLGNKSVQWGRFDLTELQEMTSNEVEREKFSLRKGDLLVCEGGEAGRCAIWQEDNSPIYFQKAIHRLRVNSPKIITRYMHEYMISVVQKSFFNDFVSQTSIKHFTQEKFKKLPILLPPLDEQRKICKISKSQDVQLNKEIQTLVKLQSLKTGLMQDLLNGKVRVGQLIRETAAA